MIFHTTFIIYKESFLLKKKNEYTDVENKKIKHLKHKFNVAIEFLILLKFNVYSRLLFFIAILCLNLLDNAHRFSVCSKYTHPYSDKGKNN
jgi:hypothetical protein